MQRKLLIVDDSAVNRMKLQDTLAGEYEFLTAADGREAMEQLQQHHQELSAVLLDLVMPKMDGYDVLRRMRENIQYAQIPTIIVTSSEEESARVKALSLGANDFILKPYNPEIVRHCLRNNIALRETSSILNAIQKDQLTGLYNREAFFERAKSMIAEQEPGYYVLSCFDIDNFKLINDRYGSAEGDRILSRVGHNIGRNVREIGGIGARISADNFAVLIPAKKKMNDALRRILNKELSATDYLAVTFSIGRYVITDTTLSPSAIYDRAFIAKQSVKGRYDEHLAYFDDTMMEKLVREQTIAAEMEYALRAGQFEVWFQPQYDHAAGTLLGAEALVRWRHPERGLIPPGEFIPLFERNGFVYEVDKFVWREVCAFLNYCRDRGYQMLPISVNVSRYDFLRTDLIDVLTGLIREYHIPEELLRLEVTESALATSESGVVEIVKKLIGLGFTVEIDDFGSGYSSLNTLKDVPAQVVKLDMRFLEDNEASPRGGSILESVVRMTKWLGMSVLAEGVEKTEQADFLKSIGCTQVQGYLYARPMPAKEFERLLTTGRLADDVKVATGRSRDEFWNPESRDTLMFNRYSGSVCVLEFYGESLELIRASDRFIHDIFPADVSTEQIVKINWLAHTDAPTRAAMLEALRKTLSDGTEATAEFRFSGLPGCARNVWLQMTLCAVSSAEDRYLIFCTSNNVTREHLLRERLQTTETALQLAAQLGGAMLWRYEPDEKTMSVIANYNAECGLPKRIENVPERQIAEGFVSAETADGCAALFRAIRSGETQGCAEFDCKAGDGVRRVQARFAAIPGDAGGAVIAVSAQKR